MRENNLIFEQLKLSLNPIKHLLEDETITDIFIYGHDKIFFKKQGSSLQFATTEEGEKITWTSKEDLEITANQIARFMKRKLDKNNPILDARLPDGSRVNIVKDPVFSGGACISIRIFPKKRLTADDLINLESISPEGIKILKGLIKAGKNILISGGTGTGKTTLLNILCSFIDKREIIVTIEDSREIQIDDHPFWAALESKHKMHEGDTPIELKDLVKNALRMFPRWIILGEVRGEEAVQMIRAFNTGHFGMGTIHANSAYDALLALENLVLQAVDMRVDAVRQMVSRAIDVVVQIVRFPDDKRRISEIVEVTGLDHSITTMLPTYKLNPLYVFNLKGYEQGKSKGDFVIKNKPEFLKDKHFFDADFPEEWRV